MCPNVQSKKSGPQSTSRLKKDRNRIPGCVADARPRCARDYVPLLGATGRAHRPRTNDLQVNSINNVQRFHDRKRLLKYDADPQVGPQSRASSSPAQRQRVSARMANDGRLSRATRYKKISSLQPESFALIIVASARNVHYCCKIHL